MYYPYFRGKQFELIAIRESAELFAASNFVPIIEPVRESLNGLKRAVDAIDEANAEAILIVNPHYGDHSADSDAIHELFFEDLQEHESICVGVILDDQVALADAMQIIDSHQNKQIALIHAGFSNGKELAAALAGHDGPLRHVFLEDHCGKLYQNHFAGTFRVLIRDGFERQINRKYPPVEFFSDLHVTFGMESVDAFGDFLIVGDAYSESGGPAYAVAIHLTFIDDSKDEEMRIFHFVSDRQDTPTDPAGKFMEALQKLVNEVNDPNTQLDRTDAVEEFLSLYERGHYPGLGQVKKLSMLHHIQTLAGYFARQ